MSWLFKKTWTSDEADEWTIHDLVASLLGVVAFFMVTVGVIGALLLQTWGFLLLGSAILCALAMYRIIDPKLRAMSDAFEAKQQQYVEALERSVRWEGEDGP
jgi:hypothetical protein